MLPWLLIGAAAALVVVACWDEIVNWLKDFIPKVKRAFSEFKNRIAHAAAVFLKAVSGAMASIAHRVYYKENNKWMEKSTIREIDEDQLPASIRRKLSSQEKDITPEIEDELQMTV